MTAILSFLLVAAVPTPSEALLELPTPSELTRMLLAQAETRAAEEAELERDMERSRARLGHGQPAEEEEQPAPAATPAVAAPATGDAVAPADDEPRPPRRAKERRLRERRPRGPEVLRDGHGKGHFLGWGITDWVIAGGMWGATLVSALYAVLFFASANAAWSDGWSYSNDERRALNYFGAGFAAVAIGLGVGGIFVALNASDNLNAWREMREEERALRGDYRR